MTLAFHSQSQINHNQSCSEASLEKIEKTDSPGKKQKCAILSCVKNDDIRAIFLSCQSCFKNFCVNHSGRNQHPCSTGRSPNNILERLKKQEVVYTLKRSPLKHPEIMLLANEHPLLPEKAINKSSPPKSPVIAAAEKLRGDFAKRATRKPSTRGEKMLAALLNP